MDGLTPLSAYDILRVPRVDCTKLKSIFPELEAIEDRTLERVYIEGQYLLYSL